jgi:hypothetical protein
MKLGLKTLLIYMAALSVALAQTNDIANETEQSQRYDEQKAPSLESERGRLANQRIQAETEIRAREEQRRFEAAEQERLRAQEEAIKSEEAIAPSSDFRQTEAASSTDMSRTLKQLRSLGELKDDGYITEEEFQRIKQKVLDSQL